MISLPPLSLYVHIPWCVQKCPYCDFNSHAQKGEIPESQYLDALLEDLKLDIEPINYPKAPKYLKAQKNLSNQKHLKRLAFYIRFLLEEGRRASFHHKALVAY